ncbi:AraC family transcriptional regulator [Opitutaceae bacterium EW11]|nr:AraC family transcriptional regulator [Opitutaceae bacterium EW11]
MATLARRVWFLVVPRTSMINVAGPWEVFGHANDLLGREAYRLEAYGPTAGAVGTRYGLCLAGVRPLPTRLDTAPDIVVVAGASGADPMPEDHAPIVPWLRRYRPRVKTVVSICTGAFALAEAGVLDGRRATTHWLYHDALRTRFPKVRVIDEGIYVEDRGVWTSAGVTAGVDLALALVESHHGHALAMRVAKRMVLFLRRSGNQAQFSAALRNQERESPPMSKLSSFVLEHLDERISVERLAVQVGMSPRTLSRWCRKHLGGSPAEVVRRLRMDEARRQLEETTRPLKEVAARAGLGDQSTLWRVFVQDLGVTPAEYRQRFAVEGS